KQIVALETVDFQIGLATQFSKEEGEAVMKWTMDDLDKLKQEYPDMLKAWQTGNSDKLEKMLNEGFQKVPKIFQRLVTDRNKRWLPKIEEWLQGDKNAVMIVGAGHLVGKEGVVELLRKKGLKVTQQ
ncbi:MAG TPA: TraB/GumN family protein, partial [Methylomirabilota bacterium]|nr:TraB/GumN family protein [Methylomirabilota bacterium]